MTAFLNPEDDSYLRLGRCKAPEYVSWSAENRSQLIRIPAASGEYRRAELRSPDPSANPYLAFALIIYAGLDGIAKKLVLPRAENTNLYTADSELLARFDKLPDSFRDACDLASASDFIRSHVPGEIIDIYCGR